VTLEDLIREYDILAHFPQRTEADLYLWITARWLELSRSEQPAGPAEAIADAYVRGAVTVLDERRPSRL